MVFPSMLIGFGFFTLLACNDSEIDLAVCDGVACLEERVFSAWKQNRASTIEVIANLEKPEEQLAMLLALGKRVPGELTELCDRLKNTSQSRCLQIQSRPHLWVERPASSTSPAPGGKREGKGPTNILFVPTQNVSSNLQKARTVQPNCTKGVEYQDCVIHTALRTAHKSDGEKAAGICLSLTDKRWQEECMFRAAEGRIRSALKRSKNELGYLEATDLCLLAGSFLQECLGHTVIFQAELAPDSQDSRVRAWDGISRSAAWIRKAWLKRDPTLGEQLVERLWSDALAFAYTGSLAVTGVPIQQLPEEAIPHLHAAAAARLVTLKIDSGSAPTTLGEWSRALETALGDRTPRDQQRQPSERFINTQNLWLEDEPGDEHHKAVFYLGTARRTTSEDPKADLTICILEALARQEQVPLGVMEQGLHHTSKEVQWTAQRLLKQHQVQTNQGTLQTWWSKLMMGLGLGLSQK